MTTEKCTKKAITKNTFPDYLRWLEHHANERGATVTFLAVDTPNGSHCAFNGKEDDLIIVSYTILGDLYKILGSKTRLFCMEALEIIQKEAEEKEE